MFEYLKDWLAEAVGWLLAGLKDLVISWFEEIRALGDWAVQTLLSAVESYFPDVASQLNDQSTLLGQINYFFPLTETVGYVVALFGLWVLVVSYKLGKSWVRPGT